VVPKPLQIERWLLSVMMLAEALMTVGTEFEAALRQGETAEFEASDLLGSLPCRADILQWSNTYAHFQCHSARD